jgi:hypothetical protein
VSGLLFSMAFGRTNHPQGRTSGGPASCARRLLFGEPALSPAPTSRGNFFLGAVIAPGSELFRDMAEPGNWIFNVAGDHSVARSAFDKAVQVNPKDARVLYERNQLRKRWGALRLREARRPARLLS